jgi:hypothetical protein
MDDTTLDAQAKLLADVIDIYSVLVDPRVVPGSGSLAGPELRAVREEPGQTAFWGDEPIRAAYAQAVMNYSVALEHGKAMVMLMTGAFTAIPVIVLARALVEVAGQAWWLLEPEIGHVKRVSRLLILRYRSAVEGQRAAEADGLAEADYHIYTETTAQVEAVSRELQLAAPCWSKKDRTYVCGIEKLPSATDLIRGMFAKVDVPSVYNLYSGYTHGQRFALLREFEQGSPVINEESFKGAVAIASYALYPPGERLSDLFGLDRDEGSGLGEEQSCG